jgi:two-component system cell cycle response regulator
MRILIADDEPISRLVLQRTLELWGYELIVARSGLEALEQLRTPRGPELAILAWMLKGIDGPGICEQIRGEAAEPYRYLILLTSKSEPEEVAQGLDSGADDQLAKPFHPVELRARIRAGRRILRLQNQLISTREALRYRATRDTLTGLLNRGVVLERLQQELSRARRGEGDSMAALLFDLDHFKHINDRYGHLAGDEVLREVGRRVHEVLRPYDHFGRYGGEEFLVVLADRGAEEALVVSERIRAVLASRPVRAEGAIIPVTASLGAVTSAQASDGEALVRLADHALYAAKGSGRNRTVASWLLPEPGKLTG